MSERLRILLLIFLMAGVAIGAAGISLFALYEAAFEEQSSRLVDAARSQARMLEAMARFNAHYITEDVPGRVLNRTLDEIADAHGHFEGFGKTGEFVLAKKEREEIVFLLNRRHGKGEHPEPVLFSSKLAEPMRRALLGESGTIVALDYRGERVLAAYEPVAELNFGLVAKIDLAEIRAPFIRAGLLAGGGALAFILLGSGLFWRLIHPLIHRLEEGEVKYRSIFEGSPNGVFLMTEVFEECNEQACRLWSCLRGELIGHSLLEFLPPTQPDGRNSTEVVQQAIDAALAGAPQFHQWQLRPKDGVLIDADISMKAIEVGGRKVLLTIIRDITERRQIEHALHESEKRYYTLAEVSPVGLFHTNAEGKFLYVNERWCDITGFSREEALEKGFALGLHPEDRERVLKEWCDAAEESVPLGSEYRMVHTDGAISWVCGQVVVEKGERGEVVGYVGTITDISGRKQIEEALEERNEFIEAIMVNLPIGLIVLSFEDLKVQYLNPKIEEIVGWPREKLGDMNAFWEEAVPDPTFRRQMRKKVRADLESGDLARMVWEFPVTKRSGEGAELLAFALPMRERNQVIITIQDVTERKRAEEELKERNEFIETVMENLPIGLSVEEADTHKYLYANQKVEEILGWPREELWESVEAFWERLQPDPDMRKKYCERIYGDIASADPARMAWEVPITRGSGEVATLLVNGIPMAEKNLMILTFQDITERKRAEMEVRERKEFIETILENLPIGLAVVTFGGRPIEQVPYSEQKVRYMNRKMEEILGWSKELLPDVEAFWERAVPDLAYRKEVREKIDEAFFSGDPAKMVYELQVTKKSGEKVDVLAADIPMFEKNIWINTMQDITERKRAQRLQAELEFAAEVQSKLLPQKAPSAAGFEVAAWCLPAHQVGGDFYDWQEVSPGLVTLTLGDVMGKGIAAAMLMATVRATLRAVSHENPPALALKSAARALRQDLDISDSFVTLFHAQLNQASRNLTYVDCGHGFVFLRRLDGRVEELLPRGVPLGVPSTEEYQEGEVTLEEGDALVLYSDGLIDALPELALDNEALAKRLEGVTGARDMVERLVGMVPPDTHRPDDLTVVVVRCKEGIEKERT